MPRVSLFESGASTREVFGAMVRDQNRMEKRLSLFDLAGGAALAYLVRKWPGVEIAAVFVLYFATTSGLRHFVDQSVRNFYLHHLDWIAAERQEIEEAELARRHR